MFTLTRRILLSGGVALPIAIAHAQDAEFPDRPLRFVVGFPPGGPNDLLARLIAPGIGERLKRTVVVENRAGANGEIAAASVAKAPADGSVFMLASNGSTTVAPAFNRSLPFDVRTDFAAVAPVGINPMLLVVAATSDHRPSFPISVQRGLRHALVDEPAAHLARRSACDRPKQQRPRRQLRGQTPTGLPEVDCGQYHL